MQFACFTINKKLQKRQNKLHLQNNSQIIQQKCHFCLIYSKKIQKFEHSKNHEYNSESLRESDELRIK